MPRVLTRGYLLPVNSLKRNPQKTKIIFRGLRHTISKDLTSADVPKDKIMSDPTGTSHELVS